MPKYLVKITQIHVRTVEIEAETAELAKQAGHETHPGLHGHTSFIRPLHDQTEVEEVKEFDIDRYKRFIEENPDHDDE